MDDTEITNRILTYLYDNYGTDFVKTYNFEYTYDGVTITIIYWDYSISAPDNATLQSYSTLQIDTMLEFASLKERTIPLQIPFMNQTDIDSTVSYGIPKLGSLIYNSTTNNLQIFNGSIYVNVYTML